MQFIVSKIRIPLGDEHMVTSVKSGNLLEMTRHEPGANPTDSIAEIKLIKTDIEGQVVDAFKASTREIEPATFGMGMYNRLTEIDNASYDVENVPAGYAIGMIFWSTETGDYQLRPSMIARGKDWQAIIEVTRTASQLKVEESEIIDWERMSRADRMEFVLRKFSELLDQEPLTKDEALRIATHRHYKGGLYRELGKIRNADDGNVASRVLYLHLFPHENSAWHRDAEEFHGFLDTGTQRFAPIEDTLPFILNDDGLSTEIKVVLRQLDDKPETGKVFFGGSDVDKHLTELNERARSELLIGEYDHPEYDQADERRWYALQNDRACCRFMGFSVSDVTTLKGKRVKALVAKVQPYGPLAMDFMQAMRTSMVGFGMRAMCMDTVEDLGDGKLVNYRTVDKIITFDFVKK